MTWSEKLKVFLLKKVKWGIQDIKLYEEAMTHSSFAHEMGYSGGHNERLEFLGDAVLELIVSDYLYHTYPLFSEGKLTRLRADLVCEASLARIAYSLDISSLVRLGKGEAAGGGINRPSLLADVVESLIGALYLDLGLGKCRSYVLELYRILLNDLKEGALRQDFKTLLQEFTQDRLNLTPDYRIILEEGPDHNKTFTAEVLLGGKPWGRGEGNTKKEAEQKAAEEAWKGLTT